MDDSPTPGPVDVAGVDPMLAAAVMASRTAMAVFDPHLPDTPMVLVNRAFCRLTGYPAEELIGRNSRMLQGPLTDHDAAEAFADAMATGRETTVELLNYRRDGERFWNEMFMAPVVDAGGRLRYYVGSAKDNSVRRQGTPFTDPLETETQALRTASWRWEPGSGQMVWSEAASQLFGVSLPPGFDIDALIDMIHPDDRAAVSRSLAAMLTVGQMTFDCRIERRGELRWIEAAGSVVVRNAVGAATLVTGAISDVTARRQAERSLQSREARSRLALDAARAGAWELDTRSGRAITSPRHDEIMGHSRMRGAWSLDHMRRTLLAADRDAAMAEMEAALARHTPLHLVARIQTGRDSMPRWIEYWGRSVGPDGASYYGIVTDVTERKRAEAALAKAEAAFRLALQAARLGRWDLDLANGEFFWDDRLRQIFGGLHGIPLEAGSDAFGARVHEEDRAAVVAAVAEAQDPAGDGSFACVFRLAPLAGEAPRWVQCFGLATFADGHCLRFLGVCQDVTEERRSARALQDMNATLEAEVAARTRDLERTWRLSQELLAVTVAGQGLVSVNPSWQRVLGWTPAQLYGRSMLDLVHPEDLAASLAETRRAEAGSVSLQFRNRCKAVDGSYRFISWTTVPEGATFYLSGRDVSGLVESANALEQAEAQMRQMQKMEAVGQLTGGIAHDFNNMLSVVIGGLTLVQRRLARGDTDVCRFIDAALDGAQRAGALTQRLLAFSRQQPTQPRTLDLGRLVAGMSDLLHRTLGETIQIGIVAETVLWRVHVDPSQMENVVLNLAVNARDAMPAGGQLTLTLANFELDGSATTVAELAPGQYATLAVTDTGVGMQADVLARAFEPFFTTKSVGAGTGLGLSQAYGFARQSGGHVRIESQPGRGTSVCIYLPRHRGAAENDDTAIETAAPPQGRGETILLVEDEDRLRQFSAEALRELNYAVVETNAAAPALRALAAHPQVALLFTDIVMPEVNGSELAEEALRRRPGLKVLFTTGYARNTVVHDGVVDAGAHLLTKPFTIFQLAVKLRELLDGG